jgi:hypothetical protein
VGRSEATAATWLTCCYLFTQSELAVFRLQCDFQCLLVRCRGVSIQLSNECFVIRNQNQCSLKLIVILLCVHICAVIVELGTVV